MDDLLKLETETFNKLYTDYRLRFIRFAQTYIPDISIAEDIVMDTLAYYWEHRRDIKNDENILSYLLTAIKHKCLNYLTYIIHSGFISGYQNRYGDNLKPPTNVYHRMTA